MARDFDRRLDELGGKRLYEKGEGDDDSSLEEDFEQWRAKVHNLALFYTLHIILSIIKPGLGTCLQGVWIRVKRRSCCEKAKL